MDHAEVRELLELAAVEPTGLDRIMAGDTPAAAALAGHLAGCAECTEEMNRLRTVATILRAAIDPAPPADLKRRTLAHVRSVGVARETGRAPVEPTPIDAGRPRLRSVEPPVAIDPGSEPAAPPPAEPAAPPPAEPAPPPVAAEPAPPPVAAEVATGGRPRIGLLVAIAAGLILAVGATGISVSLVKDGQIAAREAELARQLQVANGLARAERWTLRVSNQADARRVDLTSTTQVADATIIFSPSSREVVVVATGLAVPPAGSEYRCWLQADGPRSRVGRMFFGGGIAWWAGEVPAIGDVTPGTVFGISLVDLDSGTLDAAPVVSGGL